MKWRDTKKAEREKKTETNRSKWTQPWQEFPGREKGANASRGEARGSPASYPRNSHVPLQVLWVLVMVIPLVSRSAVWRNPICFPRTYTSVVGSIWRENPWLILNYLASLWSGNNHRSGASVHPATVFQIEGVKGSYGEEDPDTDRTQVPKKCVGRYVSTFSVFNFCLYFLIFCHTLIYLVRFSLWGSIFLFTSLSLFSPWFFLSSLLSGIWL